jgi:1-acyl-sn-glycerol-3-phosphate acyltransferase
MTKQQNIPPKPIEEYNHTRLEKRRRFLRFLLKWVGFTLLAKLDHVEGLENVPSHGPAILMINHIAFIDPIVVLHVLPRNIVPLAKIEVYRYPVVGVLPRLWEVIPVRREEVDRHAIQQTLSVLRAGEIVLVAPEGTRGPKLKSGKEGIAYLGSRSGAPIVPVAIEGTEGFPAPHFTSPWKHPGALIRFGPPFCFRQESKRSDREALRKMTDEAMYILAALLPPERRGAYSDLSRATQDTIQWLDPQTGTIEPNVTPGTGED